ncbi:MAG: efflux RND transporter periplasmic adaptor subunit [Kiritimatiellia bacterium]
MPPTAKEKRLRRRRLLTAITVGFFIILLAGFIIPVDQHVRALGYVTSDQYAEVRPPRAGRVEKIFVQSGARVKEGDLLIQLDASEEQAVLDEAKSRAEKAEAELVRREAEIAEEKRRLAEDIAVANLKLSNVVSRLERSRELFNRQFVTAAALEEDILKEQLTRAELAALTNKDLTVYDKQIRVLSQELDARHDAMSGAEVNVAAKQIKAPLAGQVLRYEFMVGEMVRPETVLFEIFGGTRLIMKLRIPEQHATRVAVGNPYSARLSSFRGLKNVYFEGRVEHMRNVIQSEGQQTYRVVYCSFDPRNFNVPPGTTAEAKIYYGKTCFWFFLFGLH